MVFVAIDFETANYYRDSACEIGLAWVENGRIIKNKSANFLIRPPTKYFKFTDLHGIDWSMVKNEPTFEKRWSDIEPILESADFLVAHNAPFDRSVLNACCEAAGLEMPDIPFRCTLQIARQRWKLKPAKLSDVCEFLDIPYDLNKAHSALYDAMLCAQIMIEAQRQR